MKPTESVDQPGRLMSRVALSSAVGGVLFALPLLATGRVLAGLNLLGGVVLALGLLYVTIQTGRALLARSKRLWIWLCLCVGKLALAASVLYASYRYEVLDVPWVMLGYSLHLVALAGFGMAFSLRARRSQEL